MTMEMNMLLVNSRNIATLREFNNDSHILILLNKKA